MKSTSFILVVVIILGACSSSKKTTSTKKTSSHITQTDIFRGGSSIKNAIVIKLEKEEAGVKAEYEWLGQNYPGYTTIRKSQTTNTKKHYDIITIRTREGDEKNIYFDITSFFGK